MFQKQNGACSPSPTHVPAGRERRVRNTLNFPNSHGFFSFLVVNLFNSVHDNVVWNMSLVLGHLVLYYSTLLEQRPMLATGPQEDAQKKSVTEISRPGRAARRDDGLLADVELPSQISPPGRAARRDDGSLAAVEPPSLRPRMTRAEDENEELDGQKKKKKNK